ncbi:MAG TPA: Holliday junction branch migration protein RuvA [Spirochaetota bacterium]|nr:Holliday junction branch migration protein RuvA [Spirochaetota bacterium]
MIAKLKGFVDEIQPTELILDVKGVGYGLTIPVSTYEKVQAGTEASLYVHTIHKEDQFRLFGFFTRVEKDLFIALINVSGIGPAMAISLLSGMAPDRLIDAIKNNNIAALTRIPGIGKTKAEKLVFELKRKLPRLELIAGPASETDSSSSDAIQALVSLGFSESDSSKCVAGLVSKKPDITIEEIIKDALKILA